MSELEVRRTGNSLTVLHDGYSLFLVPMGPEALSIGVGSNGGGHAIALDRDTAGVVAGELQRFAKG